MLVQVASLGPYGGLEHRPSLARSELILKLLCNLSLSEVELLNASLLVAARPFLNGILLFGLLDFLIRVLKCILFILEVFNFSADFL